MQAVTVEPVARRGVSKSLVEDSTPGPRPLADVDDPSKDM